MPDFIFIPLYYDDPEHTKLRAALIRAVAAKQLIPERYYADGDTPCALAVSIRTGDAAVLEPTIESASLKESIFSDAGKRTGTAEDLFKAHRKARGSHVL
jgi:hypothetical protein